LPYKADYAIYPSVYNARDLEKISFVVCAKLVSRFAVKKVRGTFGCSEARYF